MNLPFALTPVHLDTLRAYNYALNLGKWQIKDDFTAFVFLRGHPEWRARVPATLSAFRRLLTQARRFRVVEKRREKAGRRAAMQ